MEICCNCGQPVSKMPSDKYSLIITNIAMKYGVTYDCVMGKSRFARYKIARQEAYWTLHSMGLSSAHIGRIMNRDHTTVLYGIKQHENRMLRELASAGKRPASGGENADGPVNWL